MANTQYSPRLKADYQERIRQVMTEKFGYSNGKATRVGFRMEGDKKVRFAKSTGDAING